MHVLDANFSDVLLRHLDTERPLRIRGMLLLPECRMAMAPPLTFGNCWVVSVLLMTVMMMMKVIIRHSAVY